MTRPPPVPPRPNARDPSAIRTARPKVQIPPGTYLTVDPNTRLNATGTRPRFDSYTYAGHNMHMPEPDLNQPGPSTAPYTHNGRLGLPTSPISRSWSAEQSQLHAHMVNPRTANAQLQRPATQFENVSGSWGLPMAGHGLGGAVSAGRNGPGVGARPWEGSAFTLGSTVSVGDVDWDSGYEESSQASASARAQAARGNGSHRSSSVDKRQQQEWIKNRWGMDSETSFETAINAEQIGSGVLADQLSEAVSSQDKLSLFHTAATSEFDEWPYVVPEEARNILDRDEIQRQCNIYELVKSERNFVISMQIFLYIFRDGLLYANPPVITPREKLEMFIHEVFFNAQEILSIHLQLRDKLYERQRDQHPIIHSIADIYLKWLLEHKEPYTKFQKHLPKSLNFHKTELRHNTAYRNFFDNIPQILTDLRNAGMDDPHAPRLEDQNKPTLEFLITHINKQDFNTFLNGFNNRFTRLELQLNTMARRTAKDHPDVYGDIAPIPLIVSTLKQVLIMASVELETLQNRVEFENFCKKLHFRKGEMIDLDWYDDHRQLFMHGILARRQRRDVEWHGWTDLYVGLLDNYLVITKEVSHGSREQYNVVSRPIPLDYLRLAKPFNGPPEMRRAEGRIIRDKLLGDGIPMYPFTVYHVTEPLDRRYTFYAESEGLRSKWLAAFQEAKTIRDTYQNENKFFAINLLSGRRFNTRTVLVPSEVAQRSDFLGQVCAAAPFAYGGEHYLVYSTRVGIYMGLRHRPEGIQKIMRFTDVEYMVTLQGFNKLVLLANESLYAYPFQSLVRVWRREADISELGVSGERVSRHRDGAVQFFRAGICEGRMLVGYVTKSLLQVQLHVLEAVNEPTANPAMATRGVMGKFSSSKESHSTSFPQYGLTLSLPRDTTDLAMLNKRLVVMCQSQIVILDPRDPSMRAYPVPDFMVTPSLEYGSLEAISSLKDRCTKSKALGMVLSRSKELMIVYADFGCYVTKYGAPARQSAFVRWEARATSVAFRWPHALLFSPDYIEVRNVESGGLVQVIQEREIRLLYSGPPYDGPILAAMRGDDDAKGKTDSVFELLETAPIEIEQGQANDDALWREWGI